MRYEPRYARRCHTDDFTRPAAGKTSEYLTDDIVWGGLCGRLSMYALRIATFEAKIVLMIMELKNVEIQRFSTFS